MPLTDEERRRVADDLVAAERTGEWIEPLSLVHSDADVSDAYAIGRLVTATKVAAGRTVKGHKVGLTSKPMREMFGVDEPDFGTLFDNWFLDEGSRIPRSALNRPLVEIELLFVLGSQLGGPGVIASDVIRATEVVLPAMEVVDTRWARSGQPGVVDSIADAASCGRVIVGGNPMALTDIDLRHVGGALYRNGEVIETGTAAAVMGNPVNSVAWLARKLHEFDVTLEPGQCVLSGSFIRAVPVAAGDSFVADFGPLGQISFGVTG